MENKKDIGKAFKEKLEQLDKTPSDRLWADIEKDLDAKKKRRPILWLLPILLALGLSTYYYFSDSSENNSTTIEQNNEGKRINAGGATHLDGSEIVGSEMDEQGNGDINGNESFNSNNDNENINSNGNENKNSNHNLNQNGNSSLNGTTESEANRERNSSLENKKATTKNQSLVNSNPENLQDQEGISGGKKSKSSAKTKSGVVKNTAKLNSQNTPTSKIYYTKEPIKIITNSKRLVKSTPEFDEYEVVKKYTYVIKKKKVVVKPKNKTLNPSLASKSPKGKNSVKKSFGKNISIIEKSETIHYRKKKTPKNIIENTKTASSSEETTATNQNFSDNNKLVSENIIPEIKKDTVVVDSLQKKVALKDKKKKKIEEPKEVIEKKLKPTYIVSGFYGPTIYGLFSKNSPPNINFKGLEKGHPITSYYGFSFKTLYRKIGFRAGLSKINLSLSNRLNQDQLIPSYNNITLNSNISPANITQTYQGDSNVKLTHELSYYELPIEFYYSIFEDKHKISVGIFSGWSYMIRDRNTLYMSSDQKNKSEIGHVNNVIDSNLSVALGIGLSYNIYKNIYFDCNPVLKFYGKTFKDYDPPKPYSLSLQTGFSYKF